MDKTLRDLVTIAMEYGEIPFVTIDSSVNSKRHYEAVQILVKEDFIRGIIKCDMNEKGHGVNMRYTVNMNRLPEMLIKYG
jgi:hypothetical protein